MKSLTDVEGSEFERALRSAVRPVLAHFYASWCGESRILNSILELLAEELANELQIVGVNLDYSPELARRYGIRDVPELILFQQGAAIVSLDPWQAPLDLKASLRGLLADYATPSQA